MNNSSKTILFLGLLSVTIILTGKHFLDRQGLLLGFILALSLNTIVYLYSDLRLKKLFHTKKMEGQDPWGASRMLEKLASKMKLPLPELYICQLPVPTSFSVGRNWNNAAIIISESLLETLEADEVEAIIAFEMTQIKNMDTLSNGVSSALAGGVLSIGKIFDKIFHQKSKADKAGFSTGLVAPIASFFVRMGTSPQAIFRADQESSKVTGKPEALAHAIWKLESYAATNPMRIPEDTAHLFIVNPLPRRGWNKIFHSQPKTKARIKNLIGQYPI